MRRAAAIIAITNAAMTFIAGTSFAEYPHSADPYYMNERDKAAEPVFAAREADWRNGAVVYQVIVDRYVPPADIEAKRPLYPAPKRLLAWDETPKRGTFSEEAQVWTHEIDFWGGDLQSLGTKLDYVADLGVDVLYLNPIHKAYTNHKYDAQDYFEVSPEYGTRDDVKNLAEDVHARGMKLMLDGVFNHMGRTSPHFKEAMADPKSPWRDWYFIGSQWKMGYRAWVNVPNLPDVNLENPAVQARLWGDGDSVVQGYLRDGVDGWRLDVGHDIGFRLLGELTRSAHAAKPGSLVIGEIWNYPEEWSPSVDGVMNMVGRQLLLDYVKGSVSGPLAGKHFERMVADAGIEPLLKSWMMLDNHDTPRLKTALPEPWQQAMAQTLQFTLPGSPCVYYGVEAGMTGGDDPEMRAPMRWDLAVSGNPDFDRTKQLLDMRRRCRALRIGDFRLLDSENLLAFMRRTNRAEDTIIVVANATDEPASDTLLLRDSKIMSFARFEDELSDAGFNVGPAILNVTVPARTIYVLKTKIAQDSEYTPYKRVY